MSSQHIEWPKTISNKELWETTKQIPISSEIKMRKWKWIGHTLRKDQNNITRQGLDWNPQGERRKGRPSYLEENNVSRTTRAKVSWKETKKERERVHWQKFVMALCST
jgi:hypothetical protein